MVTDPPDHPWIFISYNRKDKPYLDRLKVHLKPYERDGKIRVWDDSRIQAGKKWRAEIRKAINSANIAILLVSADFLHSDFIANEELPLLLDAADQRGATILSVILSPCAFKTTKLAEFQAINDPTQPLEGMTEVKQDEVWVRVAEIVSELQEQLDAEAIMLHQEEVPQTRLEESQPPTAYPQILPKPSGTIKKTGLVVIAFSLISIVLVVGVLSNTFFKSGNTITQHQGTPTPSPTMSLPTSTTSTNSLDPSPIVWDYADVDNERLLNDDPTEIAHLQQEVRATPGLAGKHAGLVETFAGVSGNDLSESEALAQKFDRDVLQDLGKQGFVFINPAYQVFHNFAFPSTTVECYFYVYK